MRGRVVLFSYLIVAASAALPIVPFLIAPYDGYPYYGVAFFPLGITNAVAVAGMILGPYFGLAGLIAKDKSVWVEVNRMLHAHISVPIVGGLVLFYSSILAFAFVLFLPTYILFVILVTLITVMASRTGKASTGTPANAPGSPQPSP